MLLWFKADFSTSPSDLFKSQGPERGLTSLPPQPEANATLGWTTRPQSSHDRGASRRISSPRLTWSLRGLRALGGAHIPLHRVGLWDGEGQDLGPLGHRPHVDAVAGPGRVRVEVHLSARGGPVRGGANPPRRPHLHSCRHSGAQQRWIINVNQ